MTAPLTLQARLCPICGDQGRPELVSEAHMDESRLDSFAFASRKIPEYMHHRLVRCHRCDLLYADPAPPADVLTHAYLGADFDTAGEARLASRTYGRLVDAIVDRLPGRAGALDIGTGDGSFLEELLNRGFTDVSGIEPSAAPIARAAPAVRPLIHHGVFEPGRQPGASLSLVTCFQTIEHVPDPLELAREAVRLLRPGGAFLLVGHNRQAFSARLLGKRSPIFDIEHLQLFSRSSARTLLETVGLVGVTVRPLINRYPVTYWTRLSPLPTSAKRQAISILERTPIGSMMIPIPAGNISMLGFRQS